MSDRLNMDLLEQVKAALYKQAFVPMPGGQAEPVAGASQATAAMNAPMGGPPPGPGGPQGGPPPGPGGPPPGPGGPPPGPGGPPPGPGGAPGGGQVDPQTGLPIDPNTGMPMDPQTGLLVDVQNGVLIDPASGQAIDPNTMQPIPGGPGGAPAGPGGAPPQGGPQGAPPPGGPQGAPPPEQGGEPSITIQLGDLKKLFESAVHDALMQILPKEISGMMKQVSDQVGGPDLDNIKEELQRNNEMLRSLIHGEG